MKLKCCGNRLFLSNAPHPFQSSMFGHNHNQRRTEANEPLLAGSRDNLADDRNIFQLDSDDEDESSALNDHVDDRRREHGVRFEEHVQVIRPPLRSMLASRETGEYVF